MKRAFYSVSCAVFYIAAFGVTNVSALEIDGEGNHSVGQNIRLVQIGYAASNEAGESKKGPSNVTIGAFSTTYGYGGNDVAIGEGATTYGNNGVAIGGMLSQNTSTNYNLYSNGDDYWIDTSGLANPVPSKDKEDQYKYYWTTAATGHSSIALGMGAQAGFYTFGVADFNTGRDDYDYKKTMADYATALGSMSGAFGKNSTAIGYNARVGKVVLDVSNGSYDYKEVIEGIAIGSKSLVEGNSSIAIGFNTNVTGEKSIAIGYENEVNGNNSGVIGDPSVVDGNNSYGVGNNLKISANNAFVLGNEVIADVANSVYLGDKSIVTDGTDTNGTYKNRNSDGSPGSSTTTAGANGTYDKYTIAGTEYKFAGAKSNGAVSVGAAGMERRIQNVAAGEISGTSTDAINGSQLYAVIEAINALNAGGGEDYTQNSSSSSSATTTTTLDDGTTLDSNGDPVSTKGKQTRFLAAKIVTNNNGESATYYGENLATSVSKNGDDDVVLAVAMAENLKKINSITKDGTSTLEFGKDSVKIENESGSAIELDGKTATIKGGKTTLKVSDDGINAGGAQIHDVAAGTADTDAVNMGQLKAAVSNVSVNLDNIYKEMNANKRDMRAGIASATAIGGLPQSTIPGKSLFALGGAHHEGQGAVAMGISQMSDNGKWVFKASAGIDTRNHSTQQLSVGFHF